MRTALAFVTLASAAACGSDLPSCDELFQLPFEENVQCGLCGEGGCFVASGAWIDGDRMLQETGLDSCEVEVCRDPAGITRQEFCTLAAGYGQPGTVDGEPAECLFLGDGLPFSGEVNSSSVACVAGGDVPLVACTIE